MNNISDKKSRILVVDDEANNRKLLQQRLKDNYRVSFAINGKEALDVCSKVKPDVVLLDIMMPEMDGFEVCRRLKASETLKKIPVIFITALNETADKISAFSAGGVDYITKPFQFEEVNARVRTHIQLSHQKLELQQAYKKLREVEALRDSLVHMVVHDMRSPLSAVLGNLELIQIENLPAPLNHCINNALSSAKNLSNMMCNLLDVSKMEAGQMNLSITDVNLQDIVNQTIKMFDLIKGNRTLIVVPSDQIALIQADENMLQRVIQNFIDNAIKFTDEKNGKITVYMELINRNQMRLSVTDNGHGIASEHQGKVFDKFFQVELLRNNKTHSSGLGMTFCKLAIEAHGGQIGLNSEVEKGSTFWFELPVSNLA